MPALIKYFPTSNQDDSSGQSLIEVMIVITVLGLLITPVMLSLNNLNKRYSSLHRDAQAYLIAQENLEVVTNVLQSQDAWDKVPQPSQPQTYAPLSEPNWNFTHVYEPVTVKGSYKTWLIFCPVCRDGEGNYIAYTDGCNRDKYAIEVISEAFWGENREAMIGTMFVNLSKNSNDLADDHKVLVCHVPPENSENAFMVSIDRNAWIKGL